VQDGLQGVCSVMKRSQLIGLLSGPFRLAWAAWGTEVSSLNVRPSIRRGLRLLMTAVTGSGSYVVLYALFRGMIAVFNDLCFA